MLRVTASTSHCRAIFFGIAVQEEAVAEYIIKLLPLQGKASAAVEKSWDTHTCVAGIKLTAVLLSGEGMNER